MQLHTEEQRKQVYGRLMGKPSPPAGAPPPPAGAVPSPHRRDGWGKDGWAAGKDGARVWPARARARPQSARASASPRQGRGNERQAERIISRLVEDPSACAAVLQALQGSSASGGAAGAGMPMPTLDQMQAVLSRQPEPPPPRRGYRGHARHRDPRGGPTIYLPY